MAQNIRQSKLFAAEDYVAVYESYINANLQAFDYDTIRAAMVNYVRSTYPENYNDWIESSEFVALLDVVAQMGHNLAFRVDLNSRNNFLSTAERQDSVYKLAEFIGYTPRRNVPAFGEMKVVSVKTNESVIGSAGTSLGGQDIKFESTSNVNNLDDFIAVMNSILQFGNQYGSPKKQTSVNNITQQFYDLNNTTNQIKYDITGLANGKSSTYNVVSVDLEDNVVYEKSPNPTNAFGLYYKNSGLGLSNKDTGFFFAIKEGTLAFQDTSITEAIDNQTIDINVDDVNNSDVWVQTINKNGSVVKDWTNVKNVNAYANTSYNGVIASNRDIFSVKTRQNNQVSVNFADQTFGNAPKGIIRVWYRVSKNESYIVRPDDLANKKVTVDYNGIDGNTYTATITLQLKTSITNASSAETLDSIKQNAPLAYASQNRLVTANDYNTILGYQTSSVVKVKSLNRTFSGHSRYVDFTDPTGEYSNLLINGTDGRLYEKDLVKSKTTVVGQNKDYIFEKYVKPQLSDFDLINLYYTKFTSAFNNLKTTSYSYAPITDVSDANFGNGAFRWNTPGTNLYNANTGFLLPTGSSAVQRVGKTASNYLNQFRVGALVKFILNDGTGNHKWAKVLNVFAYGLGIDKTGVQLGEASGLRSNGLGSITLDTHVPDNSFIDIIIPPFPRLFKTKESNIITTYLEAKRTFALTFDYQTQSWELDSDPGSLTPDPAEVFSKNTWLIYFSFSGGKYNIYTRATQYILESSSVAFTNVSMNSGLDSLTKKKARDTIEFTSVVNGAITTSGKMHVSGIEQDSNGVIDSSHVFLSLVDDNSDNRPDNPLVFTDIVGSSVLPETTIPGKESLRFEWRHVAADREIVDPSYTNIIDVYVLDKTYDTNYRNWLMTNDGEEPIPPSSNALATNFTGIEKQKMISDTILYKPVKYKTLFGPTAHSSLRATFNVVKVKGSNVVDSEVRANVVTAINEFFAVSNWEFGETFYFTELAAYVHKELSMSISSFTIIPHGASSVFGELFEITPKADEMFLPDVSIDDIDIVNNVVTKTN
tara:strand:- start:896 stop:4030 length:3135 start_codon:yes stop_codon:yes gene_type:complete